MTVDTPISDNDDLSPFPVDKDVYRQLIEQLYEGSIQRYGIDSDQSRMFKMHLSEHGME